MKTAYSKFFKISGVFLAGVFLVVNAFGASVVSVAQYRQKLAQARERTEVLRAEIVSDIKADEDGFVRDIRRILPEDLVVKSDNTEAETANTWLSQELKELDKNGKAADKAFVLTKIIERIKGLENRLGSAPISNHDVSNSGIGSGNTGTVSPIAPTPLPKEKMSKAEARQKLEEILKRPEYKSPEQNESILSRWWDSVKKWWRNLFKANTPDIVAPSAEAVSSIGNVLHYVVIIAALVIIGFLLWRFLPYFQRVRRLRTEKDDGTRVILGETLRADENSTSLWQEAEKLAAEGNRRAAIRKGYIAVLCELGDRRIVRLAQYKTNGDYLKDVRRRDGLYNILRNLTGSFEKHWYGDEIVDESTWAEFRENYGKALKSNA